MDWARDDLGLSGNDLNNVFKYVPGESTIIHMLARDKYEPKISWVESEKEWTNSLGNLPSTEYPDSGLVLLLAKRVGEISCSAAHRVSCEKLLSAVSTESFTVEKPPKIIVSNLKESSQVPADARSVPNLSGRRGVRTVPFTRQQFEDVTKSFYTHPTISRVISRADFPIFSSSFIDIGMPACIYNCRSSNAWDMDLALSATYFPRFSLTFAILYGCTAAMEKDIVNRLAATRQEANHPLLMAGIFAEFERARHMKLVRSTVATLETHIFDIDHHYDDTSESRRVRRDERNMAKRTAWLDANYLRNGLVSWRTQIEKMMNEVDQIETMERDAISRSEGAGRLDLTASHVRVATGRKVKGRLSEIHEEYEDWIRDCTMRVDGVAMATQWAQGDTNVEIALATKSDSNYMRSIALLTMVFLPGTFLAGVFSMTFFNWNSDDGPGVSGYFWVYIIITLFLTSITCFGHADGRLTWKTQNRKHLYD
ncbi:hypothetical protein BGZ63DRAFT_414903 [Mariannaea sp. PMI_226]|nr:hypothetical protein BGZ63DRAFT_414903 [Mariannaea sp. PMI_226]